MDKLLEVSETAFFYKAFSELFSSLIVKYPFLDIFVKGGSFSFLFLNYLNERKIYSVPFFKNIVNYLLRINKKDMLVLSLEEIITDYRNDKRIIADGSVLQLLKIIGTKNEKGQVLEVINTSFQNKKYNKYFENESPVFPCNCKKLYLEDGIYINTLKYTSEEVRDKSTFNVKKWTIEVISEIPNFDLRQYKRKLEEEFNKSLDSHSNNIKNKAHVYIGKSKDSYDSDKYMIFKDIILPHGWSLLEFHDKKVLKIVLKYCDDFITKYREYIENKHNVDFPHVNFTFNMCIIGPSGSGKSQLCRSIVKYLEIQLKINIPSIFIGIDAITNMEEAMNVLVTKEINGKEYGNKAITIFDNLDDENSVLHDTQEKEEKVILDPDISKSKGNVIVTNSKSGYSKYLKTIMDSPLTPIGNMTLFNCKEDMFDVIGDEFKRRMGLIIRTTPHDYQKID